MVAKLIPSATERLGTELATADIPLMDHLTDIRRIVPDASRQLREAFRAGQMAAVNVIQRAILGGSVISLHDAHVHAFSDVHHQSQHDVFAELADALERAWAEELEEGVGRPAEEGAPTVLTGTTVREFFNPREFQSDDLVVEAIVAAAATRVPRQGTENGTAQSAAVAR